jgi:hypothetical protein
VAQRKQKKLISQREYARRRKLSHTAVQKAIATGRITAHKGKIDPAEADREWQENTDPGKPSNSITGDPAGARARAAVPRPRHLEAGRAAPGGNGTAAGYAKARAARELYQAQLAKLDLDERKGELVRAEDVRRGAFNMARKARDQLLAIPERLAAIMAATTDREEAFRILQEEVERVCEEIASDGRL